LRSKISIRNVSNRPVNFDYQYGMASMLYFKLAEADIRLANETHAQKGFKYYTFSNLVLLNREFSKSGLLFENAYFVLSSPDNRFIKSFTEGLLMEPGFYLDGPDGRADLIIERIEILNEISFGDECWFKTLSPVYVKTMRKEKEDLKEVDLYPKDPKFYENLHQNLIQRFCEFYDKAVQDHFDVLEIKDVKPKRIRIADGYRRCSL
jgi:CRISPR-associated endoribonuclease Cas6